MKSVSKDANEILYEKAKKIALRLMYARYSHKGDWITREAALSYAERAKGMVECLGQDIGRRRALKEELKRDYGLDELESLNIIDGNWIGLCVNKYNRIKLMKPTSQELSEIQGDIGVLEKCISEIKLIDLASYEAHIY